MSLASELITQEFFLTKLVFNELKRVNKTHVDISSMINVRKGPFQTMKERNLVILFEIFYIYHIVYNFIFI